MIALPFATAAAAAGGYLLGSIPFGLLLLRATGGPDPRTIGSGNIGATNVTRAGGRALGVATLVLDAGKGFLAAWAASRLASDSAWLADLAGFAAVCGHCFPVWLRFDGGKGVATLLGVSAALAWPLGPLAFAAAWLVAALVARMASIASMAACWAAALAGWLSAGSRASTGIALGLAAILVTWRHRSNFARIRAGAEPRIGRRESSP